ncbi:NAD-dependent epimerase/dehydratase family protein [Comamonas sp. Z1]|uniref:NAD-dependent epimerase/dehydratase family protein n=1 Tax=Comamonas sp. Z1 TaxID=2601246 RepID=UPI0011E8665C|nr:GDP-mannose 4,6-dehydratase [Comamonas sp. Z1]TYK71942.1 NAD-dependent epimerase/dehydratase family protein [Comamonas sp. Z1]
MSRILVTGANGFTGRYLAAALQDAGHEVHGLVHKSVVSGKVPGVSALHVADLSDAARLAAVVNEVQPDKVAHLAAIAFVAHGDIEAIYRTNLVGTRHLLEALAQSNAPLDAVLLASSANVYGNSVGGVLDENTPPAPANDYAVSKLAMEYAARLYAGRLPLITVRPFNYTGVGQAESFLIPKIVNHVRRRAPLIELGNLDVARDFSDVRNVVQLYRRLLEVPAAVGQTFNVCSGQAWSLNDVLAMVREISGQDFEVRVNPAFVRQNEVKTLLGSRGRLDAVVGAVPEIALRDTLRWMLEA